jgi:hypothetical protein
MKYATERLFADPEKAARRITEYAKGTPSEYRAGLELAVTRGWLELHESGTYVKFTATGANLFA